ncbi:MAG TPA: hypothetical protein PLJ84_12555, partial [Bacteroidales bacterium]|nr:hypothetical protein [Bacteroidales bacterium]HPT03422.1 hypothetical protein [Bacteroidales bacterium]
MKKLLLCFLATTIGMVAFAQFQRAALPKSVRDIAVSKVKAVTETENPLLKAGNTYVESPVSYMEDEVGYTVYDLQSNGSTPYGRLTQFTDGTFAAVYTVAVNPTAYNDRGTGYNYFDGTTWGPSNSTRLESAKCGWPTHAQLGANGEVVVSHRSGTAGLKLLKRDV